MCPNVEPAVTSNLLSDIGSSVWLASSDALLSSMTAQQSLRSPCMLADIQVVSRMLTCIDEVLFQIFDLLAHIRTNRVCVFGAFTSEFANGVS